MQSDRSVRPFAWSDIPALVALHNAHFPHKPQTVAECEYTERQRDPARPLRQLVIERNGVVEAYAECGIAHAGDTDYRFFVVVASEQQGRGLARQLAAELLPWAQAQQQPWVRAACREDQPRAVRFLQQAGFVEIGRRIEQQLDLDRFDAAAFAGVAKRVAAHGITLTTFDQETAPDAMQRLYELAYPLELSVPFPGGETNDISFADWKEEMFDHPHAAPANTVLAKRGEAYVGFSTIYTPPSGPAHTIMTGVHEAERGRGVALALKLHTIQRAQALGYHAMTTTNDTANPGILALNRRLGYQAQPARLVWRKYFDNHA